MLRMVAVIMCPRVKKEGGGGGGGGGEEDTEGSKQRTGAGTRRPGRVVVAKRDRLCGGLCEDERTSKQASKQCLNIPGSSCAPFCKYNFSSKKSIWNVVWVLGLALGALRACLAGWLAGWLAGSLANEQLFLVMPTRDSIGMLSRTSCPLLVPN